MALYNQGRYAEEKPLLAEAIEISRRINQPRNLAGALGNLGTILLREEQYEAALKLFQQGWRSTATPATATAWPSRWTTWARPTIT
ncbi:MAG: tetratricopeptide repeat protein [Anaerolineae bacterium]|nr:MAG: tetratricopeptide repeat protein [Anaerolineae bacterium]